jgi:hypothetical protein
MSPQTQPKLKKSNTNKDQPQSQGDPFKELNGNHIRAFGSIQT